MTSNRTRRCSRRCSPFPDPTTAWESFSADDLYKRHTLLTGVLQILEVVIELDKREALLPGLRVVSVIDDKSMN